MTHATYHNYYIFERVFRQEKREGRVEDNAQVVPNISYFKQTINWVYYPQMYP